MKIIAVDFDGTITDGDRWPRIGQARMAVIKELKKQQELGAKLILWTCREGKDLEAAVKWCREYGLEFDAVNDNLEENKARFGNNSRKVFATEYWDDKGVMVRHHGSCTNIVCPAEQGGMVVKTWRNGMLRRAMVIGEEETQ